MNQVHPHMKAWEWGHSFNRYGSYIVQLFVKSLLISVSGIQTLCQSCWATETVGGAWVNHWSEAYSSEASASTHARERGNCFNWCGLLMVHTLKSLLFSVSGIRTLSELLSDRVANNLMYIEAVADVDRGHWEVGRERRGESLPHCRRAEERSEWGRDEKVAIGRREGGHKGREEEGEVVYKYTVRLTLALSVSGAASVWLSAVERTHLWPSQQWPGRYTNVSHYESVAYSLRYQRNIHSLRVVTGMLWIFICPTLQSVCVWSLGLLPLPAVSWWTGLGHDRR